MAEQDINPLSEQHYQQIVTGLEAARIGLAQVAMAKRAGIDVSATEESLLASQKALLNLKQVYFPNR